MSLGYGINFQLALSSIPLSSSPQLADPKNSTEITPTTGSNNKYGVLREFSSHSVEL